ncbi:sulfite oxidase heme-binding subunit YedZ [Billgrantia gudaonensis]|uniref:Protein-methionine-sulfoxide reductase heme-binding subunit MsrQ n=1 Tax=Billgrantia gudaonensis TaxID=376427 RepID=A0A1G8WYV1_9GAMM|nr:protein-methionine-sulfoxide reductase heme-binding subunit MsrQ [Halomonas gudaonensis]SDJ83384.1 sulfoxide reductase heme-binding subunit YedZ [Halomonas gudaonensis]
MLSARSCITAFRLLVLAGCATPGLWIGWQWFYGDLGAVPSEAVVHFTGRTGLILLLTTIAFGPAFRLTGWVGFMIARRQIGLWAFFWLLAHMLSWIGLDQYWDWPWIVKDMVDLPYVRYGVAGLTLLVPLAVTSFKRVRQAMGEHAWHWLHRLVYVSAALGVTHLWILTRADYLMPSLFLAVLLLLVAFRIVDAILHRQ